MGGRDDIYLPGTKEQIEELARSLAFELNKASMDAEDTVKDLKLTAPTWVDFLTLGFHVLDRSLFQIYGANGRAFFMDELLREIYGHLTCEMPNAKAKEVGRNLIGRVNAEQEEYCKYREIYPKESQDTFRILSSSGKGESDYLILEFVKKFLSPGCPDRTDIFLATEAMEFYLRIQDLLRDKLCEKPIAS